MTIVTGYFLVNGKKGFIQKQFVTNNLDSLRERLRKKHHSVKTEKMGRFIYVPDILFCHTDIQETKIMQSVRSKQPQGQFKPTTKSISELIRFKN